MLTAILDVLAIAERRAARHTALLNETLAIFTLALAMRLALAPYATLASADTASRIWSGWLWLEHPHLITEGVWGPLHYYLNGVTLFFWRDPVWAPLLVHVVLGAMLPVVVYRLTLEMFGNARAALVTGFAFAVYPAAIQISLNALSEGPFLLCLGLGLLGLIRAQRTEGRMADAALAGVAIGLSTMLRYESWMMLPFLGLVLVHQPRRCAVFLALALVHPLFWMAGNGMAHGDPLYGFTWASNWERQVHGRAERVTLAWSAAQVWDLIRTLARGMTPPLVLLVAFGVGYCLRYRRAVAVWLLPPLGLFLLLVFAAWRGSLAVNLRYTATFGLMLVPFAGGFLEAIGIERWSRRRFVAAVAVLVGAISVFMIEPLWRALPGGVRLLVQPVPHFESEPDARRILALVELARKADHGPLVADTLGWAATYFVALHTKLPPRQLCLAPGAGLPMDPVLLETFLRSHDKGVLVTVDAGSMTKLFTFGPDGEAAIGDTHLRLDSVGEVQSEVARSDAPPGTKITVARYSVIASPGPLPPLPQGC
ncbi:MAG: glycosyltransferase family 39 protein [Gammaproteobacteria bacterium]